MKVLSIIFSIFRKNWVFKKPDKVDLILLDEGFANLDLTDICKTKKFNDNFIVIAFIKALFKFLTSKEKKNLKFFSDLYFKFRVELFDPKIAIGHEVNKKLFNFKKFFPKKIGILYQFGNYLEIHKTFVKKRFANTNFDYFLVWDEWHKNFFNFCNTNFIISGSVKNNQIRTIKKKKEYDLMYISSFRVPVPSYAGTNFNIGSMRTVDVSMSYVSRILSKFCELHKKKMTIALVSNRQDKKHKINRKDEIDFFKRDIKNFSDEKLDSFNLAEKSKVIICSYSTLGPELLARGHKVLFLDINHYITDLPFLPGDEGPFWYKGQDKKKIMDKIYQLLNLDDDEWKKIVSNFQHKMLFDQDNNILKNVIKKLV